MPSAGLGAEARASTPALRRPPRARRRRSIGRRRHPAQPAARPRRARRPSLRRPRPARPPRPSPGLAGRDADLDVGLAAPGTRAPPVAALQAHDGQRGRAAPQRGSCSVHAAARAAGHHVVDRLQRDRCRPRPARLECVLDAAGAQREARAAAGADPERLERLVDAARLGHDRGRRATRPHAAAPPASRTGPPVSSSALRDQQQAHAGRQAAARRRRRTRRPSRPTPPLMSVVPRPSRTPSRTPSPPSGSRVQPLADGVGVEVGGQQLASARPAAGAPAATTSAGAARGRTSQLDARRRPRSARDQAPRRPPLVAGRVGARRGHERPGQLDDVGRAVRSAASRPPAARRRDRGPCLRRYARQVIAQRAGSSSAGSSMRWIGERCGAPRPLGLVRGLGATSADDVGVGVEVGARDRLRRLEGHRLGHDPRLVAREVRRDAEVVRAAARSPGVDARVLGSRASE